MNFYVYILIYAYDTYVIQALPCVIMIQFTETIYICFHGTTTFNISYAGHMVRHEVNAIIRDGYFVRKQISYSKNSTFMKTRKQYATEQDLGGCALFHVLRCYCPLTAHQIITYNTAHCTATCQFVAIGRELHNRPVSVCVCLHRLNVIAKGPLSLTL
jgi:hypothetical protein